METLHTLQSLLLQIYHQAPRFALTQIVGQRREFRHRHDAGIRCLSQYRTPTVLGSVATPLRYWLSNETNRGHPCHPSLAIVGRQHRDVDHRPGRQLLDGALGAARQTLIDAVLAHPLS